MEVTARASSDTDDVEASLKDRKVHGFLNGLMELCTKHNVSISTDTSGPMVIFQRWDYFTKLEVDSEGASLYWPRIQTEIVVRRKNEYPKEASREKGKS